jgi:beta-N-acetylhexosaminidase
VFPAIDRLPASLSRRWVTEILRGELHFHGCVFADDLTMAGAAAFGGVAERAKLALEAGCDVLPICNDRNAVHVALEALAAHVIDPASLARLVRMRARATAAVDLAGTAQWQAATAAMDELLAPPPLVLTEGGA